MDKVEFITYHRGSIEKMHAILQKKNADYCAGESPFGNFYMCETLGICNAEAGILTRISDKLARLISFSKKGRYQVSDESFEDTILDAANYLIILAAFHRHNMEFRATIEYGKTEVPEGRPT